MKPLNLSDEMAALRSELAALPRIERMLTEMLVKRPSRAQQAKKLGVSASTLWRREKRRKLSLLVNGRLSA